MSHKQETIRIGIVGAGNWAMYGHIPALRLLPEFEITAVSSRSQENAEALATAYGISRYYSDPKSLARDPDVDLVAILTPAPEHVALAKIALEEKKDVYVEWPFTTTPAEAEDLLRLAERMRVRHIVGLQRRLGANTRYVRDLLAKGYLGKLRSVRMHVSMPYFHRQRPRSLEWTVLGKNFSNVLSIYGAHFLDTLFTMVGEPHWLNANIAAQFSILTLEETGQSSPNQSPDGIVLIGRLENGALLSVQIEGGKLYNSGLQIDLTGEEGDMRISNSSVFAYQNDHRIEGANNTDPTWKELPIPPQYHLIPDSALDACVQELAHLYAAYSKDRFTGSRVAPSFLDGLRLHRLIQLIESSSEGGLRKFVSKSL